MLAPLLMTLASPRLEFYLGTYTGKEGSQGIYHARLDPETGALSEPRLAARADNPSFLALSPDGRTLYAVHETDAGGAGAYRVAKDGGLTLLNAQEGLGAYPCHLSLAGDRLLVANYGAGSVAALPIGKDGLLGAAVLTQNRGTGPNKARQEGPHLHYVQVRGRFAYACDLGTDEVLVYPFEGGALGEPDRTKTAPGAGPRHLAFSKDGRYAYANGEMDNTVTAYAVDREFGSLTALGTLPTLPAGFAGASHTAEIALHPNGRWVYVSNRGHDSLAIYEVAQDGTLSLVTVEPAGVKEPRGFAIDPTGHWMLVGGQNDDTLLSRPLDPATGRLGAPKGRVKVGKPVCVVFRG